MTPYCDFQGPPLPTPAPCGSPGQLHRCPAVSWKVTLSPALGASQMLIAPVFQVRARGHLPDVPAGLNSLPGPHRTLSFPSCGTCHTLWSPSCCAWGSGLFVITFPTPATLPDVTRRSVSICVLSKSTGTSDGHSSADFLKLIYFITFNWMKSRLLLIRNSNSWLNWYDVVGTKYE